MNVLYLLFILMSVYVKSTHPNETKSLLNNFGQYDNKPTDLLNVESKNLRFYTMKIFQGMTGPEYYEALPDVFKRQEPLNLQFRAPSRNPNLVDQDSDRHRLPIPDGHTHFLVCDYNQNRITKKDSVKVLKCVKIINGSDQIEIDATNAQEGRFDILCKGNSSAKVIFTLNNVVPQQTSSLLSALSNRFKKN